MQQRENTRRSRSSLVGQRVESGGEEWDGVQGGEGALTIATIFLTAFRPHGRGRGGERIGFLIACTKAIHKGYKGSGQQEG